MHHFQGARLVAGVALLLSLCACSGGGGSNNGPTSRQIQLSTSAVSFAATGPDAATPAAEVVTATVSEQLANLAVIFSGRGIDRVTTTVTGNTAQLTITPSAPATLGPGTFSTTIAVTGYFCADTVCSRLEAGATQTLTATYQVSPIVDFVAPRIATAGVADEAILRGRGFAAYTIGGVKLGDVAATSLTVISDSEIHVAYPALAAGSYPVTLDIAAHQGAIPSTATLLAVDPVDHAAQSLAWPNPVTTVRSLIYDAEHGALLAATDAGGGEVVRYPHAAGAWGTPATQAIANLRDTALAIDGTQLVALSPTQVIPLDPATLAPGTALDAPSLPSGVTLKNLVFINLNSAFITTTNAANAVLMYGYVPRTSTVTALPASLVNATPGAAADGSIVALIQGDTATTSALPVYAIDASSANVAATTVLLNQNSIAPLFDRNATRLVLNGVNVYNSTYTLLGKLPDTTLAAAIRPDGQRAYTYDSAAGGLLSFNISATNNGEAYARLGDVVPLVADPGPGVKMTISPDGRTLFLAGTTQLVIQPTPLDP